MFLKVVIIPLATILKTQKKFVMTEIIFYIQWFDVTPISKAATSVVLK